MGQKRKYKRYAVGVCLIFSQLFTIQGARAANSEELSLDYPSQFNSAIVKNKKRKAYSKPLILGLPDGGEFLLSANAGYTTSNSGYSGFMGSSYRESNAQGSGISSSLSASYGLTENFYSKISVNYDNEKSTTSFKDSARPGFSTESVDISDGFSEPNINAGGKIRLGATLLFAEIGVRIPLGDSVAKQTSINETTDNNLNGGMSYVPSVGVVHDLGSVFLIGGASYTIQQERTKRIEANGFTSTEKRNGGNTFVVFSGLEFKNLLNLGMFVGYGQNESTEIRNLQTNQVHNTQGGTESLVASTYLGVKINSNFKLIPQVTYSTALTKDVNSNGYKINIDRNENWRVGLGAQATF